MYDICSDNNFSINKQYDYALNGEAKGKLASLYLKNLKNNNDNNSSNDD